MVTKTARPRRRSIPLVVFLFCLAECGISRGDLADGLIAYWSFDEGSGSVVHGSSGSGHNGTAYGASWVQGIRGTALGFDGVNDNVIIPHSPLLNLQDVTISLWINTLDPDFQQSVLEKWECNSGEPHVVRLNYGAIGITAYDRSHNPGVYSTSSINDGRWRQIVGTHDASTKTFRIYIDGVLDRESHYAILGATGNSDAVYIGMRGCSGPFWLATVLDEIAVFDRVLDPDEILDLCWQGYPDPRLENNEGALSGRSGSSGDPVNTATGNLVRSESDLIVRTRQGIRSFTRNYNSTGAGSRRNGEASPAAPESVRTGLLGRSSLRAAKDSLRRRIKAPSELR